MNHELSRGNHPARGNLNGHELNDVPILNPGDWFGTTWLVEIGIGYSSLYLIVEADSMSDAIGELAENEKYGHQIVIAQEDLGDDLEGDRHYSGTGQVLDLDHLTTHGQEGSERPFPCRYFGDGLPDEGVVPTEFESVEE